MLGASGYTGEEVVRLLSLHPTFTITALTGESQAGKVRGVGAALLFLWGTVCSIHQAFSDVYPHLGRATSVPSLVKIADVDFDAVDAVFCCLPHGTTQATLASLPSHVKIVDLSADFRLKDVQVYGEWYVRCCEISEHHAEMVFVLSRYGQHQAPELQKEAVYGLTEINRDEVGYERNSPSYEKWCQTHHHHIPPQIRGARLVANPGCYPTSVQLPLIPLLQAGLIASDDIVINSMSGVSGAGRSAKQNLLYTEIAESVNAYGITRHRHVPEIEQGLAEACGKEVTVSFTPNLMPMSRGMQSTCYVKLSQGASVDDLRASLAVRDPCFSYKFVGSSFVIAPHFTGSV